jgi:hypothetical protein
MEYPLMKMFLTWLTAVLFIGLNTEVSRAGLSSDVDVQADQSATGDTSGLQILRQGERDNRTRSMKEVQNCIEADGLEAALHHGLQAINIDLSNGYAYFCTGASMIIYKSENAEDALPYIEHS